VDHWPPGRAGLTPATLDALLEGVVREHKDRVVGWLKNEPGSWGFLAGQAVTACRRQLGRPLSQDERRVVWDRLWWWLEQIKAGVTG
jgi:hypothetical protein